MSESYMYVLESVIRSYRGYKEIWNAVVGPCPARGRQSSHSIHCHCVGSMAFAALLAATMLHGSIFSLKKIPLYGIPWHQVLAVNCIRSG